MSSKSFDLPSTKQVLGNVSLYIGACIIIVIIAMTAAKPIDAMFGINWSGLAIAWVANAALVVWLLWGKKFLQLIRRQ